MRDILAVISIVGWILVSILCLFAYKFSEQWATEMMKTIVPMVVQAWAINFAIIIQNKYGSSKGSEDKSKTIEMVLDRLTQHSQ